MGKRILVADDSLTIQKAFAMVLGGQDYALLAARSVEEALVAAKGARPDLIIADAVLGNGQRVRPVCLGEGRSGPAQRARAHSGFHPESAG